jgi:hypothetical protein
MLGKTTGTEAAEIMKQNPLFTSVQTGTLLESESITWKWANGENGGYAYFPKQSSNQSVYHIHPYYKALFRLREVMQTLGAPSHVVATGIRSPYQGNKITYWTWVVYLSQGVVLYTYGKYLEEDKIFDGLDFFTPTQDGLASVIPVAQRHPEWLVTWQGVKDFDFYCRDESNGKDCRGE